MRDIDLMAPCSGGTRSDSGRRVLSYVHSFARSLRKISFAIVLLLVFSGSAHAQEKEYTVRSFPKICLGGEDDLNMRIRRGNIYLTSKYYDDEVVKITRDYDLYVNRQEINLNDQQRKLTRQYYRESMKIVKMAKKIGWEGAKVGIEGAKLGVKAIAGVFRLLSPHYDSDDLERDMETEAKKIEAKAEKLEKRAERIEDAADDMEDIRYDMKREIKELRRLRWF